MDILKVCPHDTLAESIVTPYFEIVAHNHYELLQRFPSRCRFFTKNYSNDPVENDLLPISKEMFSNYPITDPGYPVLRGDLYEALRKYLELPFFGIKEYWFS